eukprot:436040-Rhodomonas_salina.1
MAAAGRMLCCCDCEPRRVRDVFSPGILNSYSQGLEDRTIVLLNFGLWSLIRFPSRGIRLWRSGTRYWS